MIEQIVVEIVGSALVLFAVCTGMFGFCVYKWRRITRRRKRKKAS